MNDFFGLPTSQLFHTQEFFWTASTAWTSWQIWKKPLGKSMAHIFMLGGWGGGWSGVVGANSTAAGGWGGWSGSQTRVVMPLSLLPDNLYISVWASKTGAGIASYVSIYPSTTANHTVGIANGWWAWGNAAGATAGAAGAAGAIWTAGTMPVWFNFAQVLAWQAGIIGGVAVAGAALTLPVTGLLVTGGTGGAWLPAAAASGLAWWAFTVPASPTPFPAHAWGTGTAVATTPPWVGTNGYWKFANGLFYYYGGTGGGSTHGTATTTGLVQASGGNGIIWSGGGGMWGALTGSTAWALSYGGAWYVLITCF